MEPLPLSGNWEHPRPFDRIRRQAYDLSQPAVSQVEITKGYSAEVEGGRIRKMQPHRILGLIFALGTGLAFSPRSEERRVGKECRL